MGHASSAVYAVEISFYGVHTVDGNTCQNCSCTLVAIGHPMRQGDFIQLSLETSVKREAGVELNFFTPFGFSLAEERFGTLFLPVPLE